MSDPSVRERLLALDTCTVSDALDRLGLPGAVAGIGPVWEGARTAGQVLTMSVVSADGQRATRHLGTAAIEMAQNGDVIAIERRDRDPLQTSSWGGLLALAAVRRGVTGVIVDGACRDIDEIRRLGLGVWARSAVPFTARGRLIEQSVGDDVAIGGIRVAKGDYVVADGSGITFIAAACVKQVLDVAEGIAAREALMARDIERGEAPTIVMGKAYEEMIHG
jgi:regulator of RNase E activity RraA